MELGKRELGRTGLHVSKLGFGASPLGNVFGNVKEADAIASVHEAMRCGINYFDTSPYYGDTLSEQILGKAIKSSNFPREQYVFSSKCGRYGDGFDFSAKRVFRSVDESLQRLNLTYIDIMICHDIEFGSLDQVISETIPALLKLKENGKIHFIGISGLPLKVFHNVLDRVPPGSVDVVLSYCHYNLADCSLVQSLPYLLSKGVGVINASPLCMGALTELGPPQWHPAPTDLKSACTSAAAYCKSKGKSISKLALQYALVNDDISSTLVGMATVDEVRRNAGAAIELEQGKNLDLELFQEVDSILKPAKNLTWLSGREENN
eukprot:c25952_g1_i1 orf=315-1277(+)